MAKFCGNCGNPVDENDKVCGKCGAPIVSDLEIKVEKRKAERGRKWIPRILIGIVLFVMILYGGYTLATTSNEPCDWCQKTPTKAFTMKDGSKSYVCADCRHNCAWCDARATKHYENALGMMTFVCDECYHDIVD